MLLSYGNLRKNTEAILSKAYRKEFGTTRFVASQFEIEDPWILVDEHTIQEFEPLYDFSKSLELQPKDVKVFSFQEVKKKTPSLRQNQVNNKDFTWKGEIHNDNALEFLNLPFDILVGLYDGPHPYLDLMVSKSKAKFKVGCKNADERLYDLIITIPAGELQLLESELKKYVTVLNKL